MSSENLKGRRNKLCVLSSGSPQTPKGKRKRNSLGITDSNTSASNCSTPINTKRRTCALESPKEEYEMTQHSPTNNIQWKWKVPNENIELNLKKSTISELQSDRIQSEKTLKFPSPKKSNSAKEAKKLPPSGFFKFQQDMAQYLNGKRDVICETRTDSEFISKATKSSLTRNSSFNLNTSNYSLASVSNKSKICTNLDKSFENWDSFEIHEKSKKTRNSEDSFKKYKSFNDADFDESLEHELLTVTEQVEKLIQEKDKTTNDEVETDMGEQDVNFDSDDSMNEAMSNIDVDRLLTGFPTSQVSDMTSDYSENDEESPALNISRNPLLRHHSMPETSNKNWNYKAPEDVFEFKLNKKLNQEMQAAKVCAAVQNIKSKAESRTITVPLKNGYILKSNNTPCPESAPVKLCTPAEIALKRKAAKLKFEARFKQKQQ